MRQGSSGVDCQDEAAEFVKDLVSKGLEEEPPNLVPVSVCLGVVESCLTNKAEQKWPEDLKVRHGVGGDVLVRLSCESSHTGYELPPWK